MAECAEYFFSDRGTMPTNTTVIAAVDGICLQTSESIGCAEELGLPAVVALNKIDLLPDEEAAQVTSALSMAVCVRFLSRAPE